MELLMGRNRAQMLNPGNPNLPLQQYATGNHPLLPHHQHLMSNNFPQNLPMGSAGLYAGLASAATASSRDALHQHPPGLLQQLMTAGLTIPPTGGGPGGTMSAVGAMASANASVSAQQGGAGAAGAYPGNPNVNPYGAARRPDPALDAAAAAAAGGGNSGSMLHNYWSRGVPLSVTSAVASAPPAGAGHSQMAQVTPFFASYPGAGAAASYQGGGGGGTDQLHGALSRSSSTAAAAGAGQPTRSSGSREIGKRTKLLYVRTDDESVNAYQCFARKQIELFEATQDDVDAGAQVCMGRAVSCHAAQSGSSCVFMEEGMEEASNTLLFVLSYSSPSSRDVTNQSFWVR